MKPVHSFIVSAHLPKRIEKLKELAYNYWWCWNSDAKELFLRIDRNIWNEVNHNPIKLLNKTPNQRLVELSEQADFTSFLDYIFGKFEEYMKSNTWFDTQNSKKINGAIAYFSTEYGINESFPNYSGGLGVLSGDHLKSSSDLGLPLVAVGLLYQQGYFRQHLTQHGWQNEFYLYNDFYTMPLILVKSKDGSPLIIDLELPYGTAFVQVWKLQIGRVPLFLLDTNIEQNTIDEYRDITDQLYGGTRETRIQQEIVLGIGGMRALKAMEIEPDVIHINEGHAGFALIERTRMFMEKYNLDFGSAKEITKSSSLFTTHTPVPAGNEVFRQDRIENYFTNYIEQLGLAKEEFISYGQEREYNPNEGFSMTVLGLKLTSYHNAVSKLHGKVARNMWHQIWKCFPEDEVPIKYVTNGIHTMTWVAREFSELFDRYLSPRWKTETDNNDIWMKIDSIPNEEMWREKQRRRVRLVLFAREYLKKKQKGYLTPDQVTKINEYLNPDALTIGFARRFATYKRAMLLFTDMDRLKKLLTEQDKPVQVLIAGKAHPHDTAGKEVIQSIIQKVRDYGLENHVVFLEDYDMVISRFLVKGCDVWLNTPVRPLEASGTSGMKAALNGTLNFSILDGWWDEAYDGTNGFAIGQGEEYTSQKEQDIIEAGELYNTLEKLIIPTFYERNNTSRIPEKWLMMMKNTIKTIAPQFSTTRMLKEYTNEFYLPSFTNFKNLTAKNAVKAGELKNWKEKIRSEWGSVEVIDTNLGEGSVFRLDKPVHVKASVHLGDLMPEDVVVQVFYGSVDPFDELIETGVGTLNLVKSEDKLYFYEGTYTCPDNGKQGFTVRVLPKHDLMVNPADLYLCAWANK